jgi:hypothetical protein
LGVELPNVDAIVDIPLIDDTAEEVGPIDFLQLLDPLNRILTAKEHIELWLLPEPFVESVDNAVDPVVKPIPTVFQQS